MARSARTSSESGRSGSKRLPVRPEQVGEQVGVAGVALGVDGRVARAARLDDVRVNRDDDETGLDERVDEQAARSLDRDAELRRLPEAFESPDELGQPLAVMSGVELVDRAPFSIDYADGMNVLRPVEPNRVLHQLPPFGTLSGAGRSYRWLIDGRSGGSTASNLTGLVARLPVVGRDLPAPPRQRVSRGLSSSKRRRLSARRHQEHRATLSRVGPTSARVDQ